MSASRETFFDRTLQALQWPLFAGIALVIVGVLFAWISGLDDLHFFLLPYVEWVMVAFFASNCLASIVAVVCILCTSSVRELRITWLLAFLFGLLTAANVVLVPLFRHYALRQGTREVKA